MQYVSLPDLSAQPITNILLGLWGVIETSPDRRRQASTQAFHPDAVGRVTSNTSVNTSKRERSLSGDLVPPAAAAAAAKRPSSEHACLHGLFDCRASCAACVDEAAALVRIFATFLLDPIETLFKPH